MNKIAAIQMCSSHELKQNLKSAGDLISEAASNGARLLVLPEMFAMMGINPADKQQVQEGWGAGVIQDFLSDIARKEKIWLVGGTIPIKSSNPHKARAACIVYNDQGIPVGRYDKIHLFDVTISEDEKYLESDTTEPGNEITIIQTPVGKLGLAVCYDIRFPELFRYMFNQGVEIIAVPAAFTIKTGEAHWELLARSRAVENFSYVIGACQGGTHASGRKTYGTSIIVEPWGTVVARRPELSPGIIYGEVDLEKQKKLRLEIPVIQRQVIGFDLNGINVNKIKFNA